MFRSEGLESAESLSPAPVVVRSFRLGPKILCVAGQTGSGLELTFAADTAAGERNELVGSVIRIGTAEPDGFVGLVRANGPVPDEIVVSSRNGPDLCRSQVRSEPDEVRRVLADGSDEFRFELAVRLAELSAADLDPTIAEAIGQELTRWVQTLPELHTSTQTAFAAIDRSICTAGGHVFVEGWARTQPGLHGLSLRPALFGYSGVRQLLVPNLSRRPDLPEQGTTLQDVFPAYAVLGNGRPLAGEVQQLLVQVSRGQQIGYARRTLEQVGEAEFASYFWGQISDSERMRGQAVIEAVLFVASLSPELPPVAESQAELEAKPTLASVILLNYEPQDPLSILTRVTCSNVYGPGTELLAVSSRGGSFGPMLIPFGPEVRRVSGSSMWDVAQRPAAAPTELCLLLSTGVMLTGNARANVETAGRYLRDHPSLAAVLLIPSHESDAPSHDEPRNAIISRDLAAESAERADAVTAILAYKGACLAPVLARTELLPYILNHSWPVIRPSLALRRSLTELGNAGRVGHTYVQGVETFRHSPPIHPDPERSQFILELTP